MKSKVIDIDSDIDYKLSAMTEAESFAKEVGIVDNKQILHLRLLAEELLGMTEGILKIRFGEFWLEKKDSTLKICLKADAEVGEKAKEQLLLAARDGKNTAYKGITGKLCMILDFCTSGETAYAGYDPMLFYRASAYSLMPDTTMPSYENWSLHEYMDRTQKEDKKSWDELERSVITKLSDDVIISARPNQVSITIVKNI